MQRLRLTLLTIALVFTGTLIAGDVPPTCREVARASGLDDFWRVEAVRFTFNVKIGDKEITRGWEWEPKTDTVTYTPAKGDPLTYRRSALATGTPDPSLAKIDGMFVNDQYWLLFPLHLVWDDVTFAIDAGQPLPIGEGTATKISVLYPSLGGYTPGDAYDLYVKGNRVVQWVYRKGASPKPTRTTTWEDWRQVGPLAVALDHKSPDGFRLWFTDVKVKADGEWHKPR